MTHSLHRVGNEEQLKEEYFVLSSAADGFNVEGAKEKLIKIMDIIEEVGPVNFGFSKVGCAHTGVTMAYLRSIYNNRSRVRAVFGSREKVKKLLRRLKEEDVGISITISGLRTELQKIAKEVGITPHSVNLSLGVFGKKDLLPPKEILEITTMCGHHLVSPLLARKIIDDVRKGVLSSKEGSIELAKPCICGFVNQERVQKVIERVTGRK